MRSLVSNGVKESSGGVFRLQRLDEELIETIVKIALEEDLARREDVTTKAIFSQPKKVKAIIYSKENGIVAGMEVAERVFRYLDKEIKLEGQLKDGEAVKADEVLTVLEGNVQTILKGERTALNFLQHLSGIATLTSKFVDKVKPYKTVILDTRKTIPGIRFLEKYAVAVGGGKNHRFGLFDGCIIKDNHIAAAGGIDKAISLARKNLPKGFKIEVEVKNLQEVKEVLAAKADVIMLDNMDLKTLSKAVKLIGKKAQVEASGGVTLDNVEEVAKTGVDFISSGALTMAAKPLDLSLEIVPS